MTNNDQYNDQERRMCESRRKPDFTPKPTTSKKSTKAESSDEFQDTVESNTDFSRYETNVPLDQTSTVEDETDSTTDPAVKPEAVPTKPTESVPLVILSEYLLNSQAEEITDAVTVVQRFPKIKFGETPQPLMSAYFASSLPKEYPWLHQRCYQGIVEEKFSRAIARALLKQLSEDEAIEVSSEIPRLSVYHVLSYLDEGRANLIPFGRKVACMDIPAPFGPTESINSCINRIRCHYQYGLEGNIHDSSVFALKVLRKTIEETILPNYSEDVANLRFMSQYPKEGTVKDCLKFLEKNLQSIKPNKSATSRQTSSFHAKRPQPRRGGKGNQPPRLSATELNETTTITTNKDKFKSGKVRTRRSVPSY